MYANVTTSKNISWTNSCKQYYLTAWDILVHPPEFSSEVMTTPDHILSQSGVWLKWNWLFKLTRCLSSAEGCHPPIYLVHAPATCRHQDEDRGYRRRTSSHPWTMDAVTCSGHREVLLQVDFPPRITTWNPNIFQFISFLLTWHLWFIHTVLPFFFSLACQCRLLDAWIQVTWHGMVIIQCNCRYIGSSQQSCGWCECNRYLANLWCVLQQPPHHGQGHARVMLPPPEDTYTVQSVRSSFTLSLLKCERICFYLHTRPHHPRYCPHVHFVTSLSAASQRSDHW